MCEPFRRGQKSALGAGLFLFGFLDRRRGPDVWTIREHLYHIAGVQMLLLGRMKTIRDVPSPVIEPYFPQNEEKLDRRYGSLREALSEYERLRGEQVRLVRSCSPEELERCAEHKEYTRYTIPVIVRHMIFHEYWHMYRIEELWLTRDEYFGG